MTGLFHAGDSEITAVDGVSLDDKTLHDAKELLQGPEGTMCKLGCAWGRSKCEWLSLSWAQWCAARMRVFASLRKNQRLCLVYALLMGMLGMLVIFFTHSLACARARTHTRTRCGVIDRHNLPPLKLPSFPPSFLLPPSSFLLPPPPPPPSPSSSSSWSPSPLFLLLIPLLFPAAYGSRPRGKIFR